MSAAVDNSSPLLQRHIHEHGLVLREFSENCSSFKCSICSSSVKGGPAYHCQECNYFFLHKHCAPLLPRIQHPFHPQHQLIFDMDPYEGSRCSGCSGYMLGKRSQYRCDECRPRVVLHLGCAAATLPTHGEEHEHEHEHEDKEETLQHIAHKHPLESFYVNSPYSPYCWACKEKISGRTYGCHACIFLLHESCALAPQEIKSHPLHPQHPIALVVFKWQVKCTFCGNESNQIVYACNQCDFNLDVRCAVSVKRHHNSIPQCDHNSEKDRQEIKLFSHPHPLTYCSTKEEIGLACDFCKEKITDDFYVCEDCSFMLHKSCAELPRDMMHPLHPDHHLILQTDPRDCALCGYDYKILYMCQECSFGLHPKCSLRSLSVSKEDMRIDIKHIHEHPMRLHSFSGNWSFCSICGETCGLGYECTSYGCSLSIHKKCAELPQQSIFSVHPQHPLLLSKQTDRSSLSPCSACHLRDTGVSKFILLCHSCKINFHVGCALRNPTLKHQRHEHSLTYFERIDSEKQYDVLCNVCGDNCRIDLYRCIPCNYNLHYSCSSLPPSVKHEWHVHPMVLIDEYINEDFDFDEQYCDLCETVRHPEHGVYYCMECRCATHIDCFIPKLDLDKRRLMDELELRKLDEQIISKEAETEESRKELEASRIKFERLTKDLEELKDKKQEKLSSLM